MSAKMTPTKRFIVRTALVTSTTLATIMGAQALASIDAAAFSEPTPPATELATQPLAILTAPTTTHTTTTENVTASAPNLVILRHGGLQAPSNTNLRASSASPVSTSQQITPPNAVQVAPPAPVAQQSAPVVQPPAPSIQPPAQVSVPSTRSSR